MAGRKLPADTDEKIVAAAVEQNDATAYTAIARKLGLRYKSVRRHAQRLRTRIDQEIARRQAPAARQTIPSQQAADLAQQVLSEPADLQRAREASLTHAEQAAVLGGISAEEAQQALQRYARLVKYGVEIARSAVVLERVRVGDPTNIVRVEHEEVIDLAAAEQEARLFLEDLERHREQEKLEQQKKLEEPSVPVTPTNGLLN